MGDIDPFDADTYDIDSAIDTIELANVSSQLIDQYDNPNPEQQAEITESLENTVNELLNTIGDTTTDVASLTADLQGVADGSIQPDTLNGKYPTFQQLMEKGNVTINNYFNDVLAETGETAEEALENPDSRTSQRIKQFLGDNAWRIVKIVMGLLLVGGIGYLIYDILKQVQNALTGCWYTDSTQGIRTQLTSDGNCSCCANGCAMVNQNNLCCGQVQCQATGSCTCWKPNLGDILAAIVNAITNIVQTTTGFFAAIIAFFIKYWWVILIIIGLIVFLLLFRFLWRIFYPGKD